MAEARAALNAVDRVEITTLVDNSIDVFLPCTKEIRRAQVPSNLPWGERKSLVSEHGYSALVNVQTGEHSASLLFDAGVSTAWTLHGLESYSRICTKVSRSVCPRKCGHSLGH